MADLPLVTIITPSYNQADFLEETIQSVLSQDYPNLEYFIIDGGSTDGSVDIIRKYADKIAWWISEKDKGQGDALNKGFARATGSYIAWINSDDYYLPNAIFSAVEALQSFPEAGMVFGDVLSIDAAGTPFNIMTYHSWGLDELMQFNIIGQPAVFMRRDVLNRSGYLDLTYNYLLDHELWLRMAEQAPIQYIPQQWAAARVHALAKNVSQTSRYGPEAFRIVNWMAANPERFPQFHRLRRRILAGAHRINGRYLLDGGQFWSALTAYLKGLWYSPAVVLPEYRRILYAMASMVLNVEGFRKRYLAKRKEAILQILDDHAISTKRDYPGSH